MSGGTIFTGEYCPPGHFVGGQYSLQHRYRTLCTNHDIFTVYYAQLHIDDAIQSIQVGRTMVAEIICAK